jgi:arabinose-5-phosphate isomerase
MIKTDFLQIARTVLETEADAITQQIPALDHNFTLACEQILNCKRRTIVIGMGKSGIIGKKIAATLASTGTPAFFVHPAEAGHGDLGMVTSDDCVILISYSGESYEINTLLPGLKHLGCCLIGISGRAESSLAQACHININVKIKEEACPLGIAPTASTTATLAIGDAIAIACSQARGLSKEDFARRHPSGALGKKLLLTAGDIMHTEARLPVVPLTASLMDAILEMNDKGLGMTLVVENNKLAGVFTDGDLRRLLSEKGWENKKISELINKTPITIDKQTLAFDALKIMRDKKITSLIVIENSAPVGVVHIHQLINAGM